MAGGPEKPIIINLLHRVRQQHPEHAVGKVIQPISTGFNKSLRVESRHERLGVGTRPGTLVDKL